MRKFGNSEFSRDLKQLDEKKIFKQVRITGKGTTYILKIPKTPKAYFKSK